ncbi:MAG: hypothetical protein QME90_07765 [Thermodesulfobacteriota bacterium]|nr:hypothetical protein [Thermodesulfobacteriota bacterium]
MAAVVLNVKNILGFRAKGREVIEGFKGYQLRERSAGYDAFFGAQKDDIGLENTYRWDINTVRGTGVRHR